MVLYNLVNIDKNTETQRSIIFIFPSWKRRKSRRRKKVSESGTDEDSPLHWRFRNWSFLLQNSTAEILPTRNPPAQKDAGYRGTSLIRNSADLGPYSRAMPRAL